MATTDGGPGVQYIDLSAFGDDKALKDNGLARNLPIVIAGGVALVVAFVAWTLLWALVSSISMEVEEAWGKVYIIGILLALLAGVMVVMRRRIAWDTGSTPLVSEDNFRKLDLGKTVPGVNLSLQSTLQRTRQIGASFGALILPKQDDPRALNKAKRYRYLGWACVVAGLIVCYWFMVGGAVLAMVSLLFFTKEAQALQPRLESARAQDKRKPVLLLRSFRDDSVVAIQRFRYFFWDYLPARRFEQAIAGSLREFGPPIAVGEPGEKLPQFGAARTYLTDDQWQGAVLSFMDESRFIVMIAGATKWIRWEAHRIREKGRLRHLFVLLPPAQMKVPFRKTLSSRKDRWDNVLETFAESAWAPALKTVDITNVLMVQFEEGGALTVITSRNRMVQDYQLAIAVAVNDEFGEAAA